MEYLVVFFILFIYVFFFRNELQLNSLNEPNLFMTPLQRVGI